MSKYRLTGKHRYSTRKRFWGADRVVVEVEVEWDDGPDDHNGMPTYLSGIRWQEASPTDMLRLVAQHQAGLADKPCPYREPKSCKHDFRRDEDNGGECCQLCGEVKP